MFRRRRLAGVVAVVAALAALLAASAVFAAVPGAATDVATARARQAKLQRQLDAATRELARIEADRSWREEHLADAKARLGFTRANLLSTQRLLGAQMASLYKAGGTRPLSSLLTSSSDVVVGRIEFETIMVDRQVAAAADARVAYDSYQQAIRDVQVDLDLLAGLQSRAKATAARLAKGFQAAKQVTDKLEGFAPTLLIDGRFYACPVSPPYSYTDTYGAPRPSGRTHQGTDIMSAYGNKIHAYVDGVISREHYNTLGGTTLYLQGADGNEYYYAHLSRYAVPQGTRVRAGALIAYNGNSGDARYTAPHLHFEVHPGGGTPVNPYPWVQRTCKQ